jgi:hypothetical protein
MTNRRTAGSKGLRWLLLPLSIVAASCSSGGHPSAAPPAASTPSAAPTTTTTPAVSLPAAEIADPGLPSQVGQGPLSQTVVQNLMQYFEDNVATAYANDDPDSLYRYMAGPMLIGNRGSVNVLKSQGKRNVYTISVSTIDIDTNEQTRVTFDMTAAETSDYFLDTTGSTLVGGAPGPSTLDFLMFIDFNPTNHTWYWTGAENEADSSGGASTGGS